MDVEEMLDRLGALIGPPPEGGVVPARRGAGGRQRPLLPPPGRLGEAAVAVNPRKWCAAPLRDRGWTVIQGPGGATVYTSPCARVSARARTDSTGTAWTTAHYQAGPGGERWWSSADSRTPPEVVAALHEVLAATLASSPDSLLRPTFPNVEALNHVIASGWDNSVSSRRLLCWTAPDGEMASISRWIKPGHQDTDWVISGGSVGPGQKEGWYLKMPATG
ncbi:DUF317 domain-containing protein [Kitasatospora sp. NPDC054769]